MTEKQREQKYKQEYCTRCKNKGKNDCDIRVFSLQNTVCTKCMSYEREGQKMKRKWTKQSAERYIKEAKQKGLTYWSTVDYLKHHKTMHSII